LNETILWLLYACGAVAAFAAVRKLNWRIVPSTLLGMVPTLLGWLILYLLTARDDRPLWWRVDLSLNLSFALIFAACGAALAMLLSSRQREG